MAVWCAQPQQGADDHLFCAALDQQWQQLLANDPDTVIATLAEAFEDNEAPSAPIGVDGDELSLVVLAPAESAVPERMPGTTQATT